MSGRVHTTAAPTADRPEAASSPRPAPAAWLAPPALAVAPPAQRAAAIASMQRGAGNGAVARMLAREPAKDPDRTGWEGKPFGGLIYDELVKQYTPEALLKLALPELEKLAKSAPAVDAVGLDAKESGQVAGGAASFAKKAAETWMASADGKAWLTKAATWTKQHPDAVYFTLLGAMVAAIAGAAIAYFSGAVDPPALEKKFKVLGLDVGAGLDLGKVSEQILQSAKLSVGRDLGGGVTLTASGKVASPKGKDGDWTIGSELKLGTKDDKSYVSGGLSYGAVGFGGQFGVGSGPMKGAYSLTEAKGGLLHDAKLTLGPLSGGYTSQPGEKGFEQGSLTFKPLVIPIEATGLYKVGADGVTLLDASAVFKSPTLGSYSLGAKGPLSGGKPGEGLALTFGQQNKDAAGSTGSSTWTFSPLKAPTADYSFGVGLAPTIHLDSSFKVDDGNVTSGTAKVSTSALKDAVKAELSYGQDEKGLVTWGTSVAIKQDEATEEVKLAFTDGQLSSLALKMGVGGKDEAVRFLVDAALTRNAGIDKASFKAMLAVKASKVVSLSFDVNASETVGGKTPGATAGGSGAVIFALPRGILVGGSADVAYGPRADGKGPSGLTAGGGLLIGHEWSPVLLKGSVMVDPGGGRPPAFFLGPVGRF